MLNQIVTLPKARLLGEATYGMEVTASAADRTGRATQGT